MSPLESTKGVEPATKHESFGIINEVHTETILFQKAINATATDLYQQMCKARNSQNKNFIFFTPNLIASLSMVYAGAPEELKTVMEQALHMGELKGEQWHKKFQNWSEGIQNRSRALSQSVPSTLKANQAGFKFQQTQIITHHSDVALTNQARRNLLYYNPEMFSFTEPEEARRLINDRVEQKTEGKIQNLVEDVSKDLVLILASAALFKGQWKYPFEKEKNSEEVFNNNDGNCVRVEMMNKDIDDLRMASDYNEDADYSMDILELPFHGDIALLLIKPYLGWDCKVQNSASQLQKYMTESNIQGLLDNYDERFQKKKALKLGIPKVTLQEKTDLLKELSHTQLAQKLLEADFTGTLVQANKQTVIPELVSEVNFTMDEEGAAVAAASYTPSRMQCTKQPKFILNGPFGLAIVDRTSQTVLGMGQVLNMDGEKLEKK